MISLKIEKLSKHYNQPLLDNISLSFTGKGVVALLGDNGCGKSTLLKILAGLESADSGSISWSYPPRIGYLMQEVESNSELSGGQKKMVLLSELIYSSQYDVLLLDEPDNHLDTENKNWFIEALKDFDGLVILISHDRHTLKSLTKYVWIVEDNTITTYPFGYEKFVGVYQDEKTSQLSQYLVQAKEKKRMEIILETFRGRAASGPKAAKTFHAMEKRMARFVSTMVADPRKKEASINITTDNNNKIIKKKSAVFVDKLNFSYGSEVIFAGADLHLFVTDKTALLSPNGTGKSTLIRLILGQLQPDSGRAEVGSNLSIGYYSQEHMESLPEELTPLECFMERHPLFDYQVEGILRRFFFSKQTMRSKIWTLSGGQKSRLQLALFLYRSPDILILDEPTNHLDIKSILALENFLKKFRGTVLLISHDRELVNSVCSNIYTISNHRINLLTSIKDSDIE